MDIQELFKRHIIETIESSPEEPQESKDTITLYHGTNSVYLNDILRNGILPRKITGNDNWSKEKASSMDNVVYLTNKWHYWYAYHSLERLLEEKYGEDWSGNPAAQWWNIGNPFPIYFECEIPKSYLCLDEDIVYSKWFKDKIKSAAKRNEDLKFNISWEDCLAHSGTLSVKGKIKKEWIKSFTIIGDPKLYLHLNGEKSQYKKDLKKWRDGKGKGTLKLSDLISIEQKYKYIGKVPTKAIPPGILISQLVYSEELEQMTAIGNTPEEYKLQPIQLDKY